MENFNLALSTVIPLVIYMLVGAWIVKRGILGRDTLKALNKSIFRIFIPIHLFVSVSQKNIREVVNPGLFIYCAVMVVILTVIMWLAFRRLIPDKQNHVTVIQGMIRSNFVLFGTSIAMSLCDEAGVALQAALSAVVVPLFNITAVILFALASNEGTSLKKILINIAKNPLVEAGIVGIIFSFFSIPVPKLILEPLTKMGGIATPLALVALGGMLSFHSIVNHRIYLLEAVLGKLVIIPMIGLAAAIIMGFRGNELVAVLAVFASPTAVASTAMAQEMGGNGELAGEIVAMTSVVCIFTLFFIVLFLAGTGMI